MTLKRLLVTEMIFVRIVQINNTGVVPYTITEYLRREYSDSIKADIVIPMHSKRDEQFQRGLKDVIELPKHPAHLQEWIARNIMNYDIIHLHALFQHLPIITEFMNADAKIVYTGHGREVRMGWHPKIFNYADKVTCSTLDLITENVEWIPNAPDPYHWKRQREPIKNKALFKVFSDPIVDDNRGFKAIEGFCHSEGYLLDIQNRGKVMYSYMTYPRFLEIYEVFFDYKYMTGVLSDFELPLSYTALQFLQMGGTVYHPTGVYDKLPANINYDEIMNRWIRLYEKLLE